MKTERLLAITMLLLEKKQISAPKLAEMFEVSTRTIYRDIDSLSQAGVPVTALPGSKGGIRIMENYKIDQQFFTSNDLVSLLIGLNSLNLSPAAQQKFRLTLEKLQTLIPQQAQKEVTAKASQLIIDVSPWTKSDSAIPFFDLLQQGISQQRYVTFAYENRGGTASLRKIEPYRLVLKEVSWYVQGYCCEKADFRLFKLNRMAHVQLLAEAFSSRELPAIDLGKRIIDPEAFIPLQLEVTFSVKEQLLDRFSNLSFTPIPDSDRFAVEFPFIPDEFGYHLLLGFGTRCRCLAPAFVRAELARRLQDMLAFYQE